MATVSVTFKEGFNKQVYSYRYNPIIDPIQIGDVVVVDSPRNGYVTADVVAINQEDRLQATKWIVSKVHDFHYKARKAEEAAVAGKEKRIRDRLAKLPVNVAEELLAQYEDA